VNTFLLLSLRTKVRIVARLALPNQRVLGVSDRGKKKKLLVVLFLGEAALKVQDGTDGTLMG
jgi:hypothetical protein